MPIYPYKTLIN